MQEEAKVTKTGNRKTILFVLLLRTMAYLHYRYFPTLIFLYFSRDAGCFSNVQFTQHQKSVSSFSSQFHSNTSFYRRSTSIASLPNIIENKYESEILSEDPKVLVVRNFMSSEECDALIKNAISIDSDDSNERKLTTSNPPKVSLTVEKLWPLPFLCLASGLPPISRLLSEANGEDIPLDQIISVSLPNIQIASLVTITLIFGIFFVIEKISSKSSRTSVSMAFNLAQDIPIIQSLVLKACEITNIPNFSYKNFEAPVITRYDSGAVFGLHNDASPNLGQEWKDLGGQRVVTVIIYLSDVNDGGGETYFDYLNLTVKPEKGKALVFYPASLENLNADDRTTHESKITRDDTKWIIQLFGRVGPRVPPPLGLPDEFNSI